MTIGYFFDHESCRDVNAATYHFLSSNFFIKRGDLPVSKSFRFFFSWESSDFLKFDLTGGDFVESSNDFERRLVEEVDSIINIWVDDFRQTLTISRDNFGRIPLYYLFVPGAFVVISTDLNELLELEFSQKDRNANLAAVSSYLRDADVNSCYSSDTFFDDIYTVLPGHYVTFGRDKEKIKRYLRLDRQKWIHLSTIEEYGEIFRDKLVESLKRDVSGKTKVGAHLSGGLDSSSIVSLLKREFPHLFLHCFFIGNRSLLGKKEERFDDRFFVGEMANSLGEIPLDVFYPTNEVLDATVAYVSRTAQPLSVLGPSVSYQINESVRGKGLDVLFSGLGGDSVVGYGEKYLNDLWESRNTTDLIIAFELLSKSDRYLGFKNNNKEEEVASLLLNRFFDKKVVACIKGKKWVTAMKLISFFSVQLGLSPLDIVCRLSLRGYGKVFRGVPNPVLSSIVNESFSLNQLKGRRTVVDGIDPTERSAYLNIFANQNIRVLEEHHQVGALHGIEFKHPYFYKDLYELSLSVPSKLVFDSGRGRGHMRAGLKGILPETVRNRTGKHNRGSVRLVNAARNLIQSEARDFLLDSSSIWDFVNKAAFRENTSLFVGHKLPEISSVKVAIEIHRVVYLSVWLNRYFG